MAHSPHLRSIFLDFEFKPGYLPEEQGLAPSNNVDFWMRRSQAMLILRSRFEDGEQTRGSQGRGGARGSEDVEETRGSQDGEETRESEDGEENGSKNGEETYGSENGREARRPKVDTRSELMN
ncbi:hypothetical protein MMC31_003453, partial [Peltigera leucophlebia]|nr:hypothetical protein [Peltigera leucophlebia]